MSTTTDALQRAIDYLGAVEVAPGRYAYRRLGHWAISDPAALADLGELIRDDGVYLLPDHPWRDARAVLVQPGWWTPERQYRIEHDALDLLTHYTCYAPTGPCVHQGTERTVDRVVTADLQTGEEVPA